MLAISCYSAVEYEETDRWNAPSAIWVSEEDVLRGVAWTPCADCGGTGFFPVPHDYEGERSCVACKASGLMGISV